MKAEAWGQGARTQGYGRAPPATADSVTKLCSAHGPTMALTHSTARASSAPLCSQALLVGAQPWFPALNVLCMAISQPRRARITVGYMANGSGKSGDLSSGCVKGLNLRELGWVLRTWCGPQEGGLLSHRPSSYPLNLEEPDWVQNTKSQRPQVVCDGSTCVLGSKAVL